MTEFQSIYNGHSQEFLTIYYSFNFCKGFAFINMREQAEVLTGVKNTASSCLITQFYFQFYIQLAAFPLCTWGPRRWQNRQACFAVISLLTVDRMGRIPLPSVILLCHWLSTTALSCPASLWITGTVDSGASLSFRDSAHIRSGAQWITHTRRSPGGAMDSLISVSPN